jgi:hypothetical protein
MFCLCISIYKQAKISNSNEPKGKSKTSLFGHFDSKSFIGI